VSPDRGRQLWLVPVLLVTVIATAVGGLLARDLYREPERAEPRVVLPTQTSVPPEEQPGSKTVGGTLDATAHPLFNPARETLQTYFDAINSGDYGLWTTVVTDSRIRTQPEEKWQTSYQSTQDGSIVIHRIELAEEDTARVLLKFTSVQDPKDAPPELPVRCIRWRVVFPLVEEDTGWKIDSGPTTVSPQHEACA
jgi:hypothetical protein